MNKLKVKKIIKIFCIIIFLLLLLGTAVFSAYLLNSKENIIDATLTIVTEVIGEQEPIFFLILGISDDSKTELSDTNILCGYNPQKQKACMISIPRDTYIGNDYKKANGNDKINSLCKKGYIETVKEVENLTGVKIDYYVVIKTKALRDIVDSIGGVEFDVPIDMNYDDVTQNLHIHLKSGKQLLNGAQVEQLLRFRHNNNGTTYSIEYGDNDYGRMKTQRNFLKALSEQLITINNISRINDITTAVYNNVETNFELNTILTYIPYCLKFNINNLISKQMPGKSKQINNLWFFEPDRKESAILMESLIRELELKEDFINSHYKRILTNKSLFVNREKNYNNKGE